MRNFSFDLSFSLQERVKTRERAISKTRDKISIDSKKQKKAKILPKRLLLLFKEEQQFRSFDQKFKKTANEFSNRQQRENNEKIRRRRSPLGRNSTHHFVVLIYINRSHLK